MAARRAGGRRGLVRPLGRELRLRRRGGGPRPRRRGRRRRRRRRSGAPSISSETHQNDDGGWGEDIRSYDDPALRAQGESTASQTAWALLALVAAGRARAAAARRGVAWLATTQLPDGNWDEPWYTGTGFPGDFYLNYHLYRLVFPLSALGRWCRAIDDASVAASVRTEAAHQAHAVRDSPHAQRAPKRGADGATCAERPERAAVSDTEPPEFRPTTQRRGR